MNSETSEIGSTIAAKHPNTIELWTYMHNAVYTLMDNVAKGVK